jgi:hypothetical protein
MESLRDPVGNRRPLRGWLQRLGFGVHVGVRDHLRDQAVVECLLALSTRFVSVSFERA